MLTMPSLWNLTISALVFFIAAWYLYRYLDEQGIQKGMTRGIVILTFASLVSWGAGVGVDWIEHKIAGPQAAVHPAVQPSAVAAPDSQDTAQE